MTLPRIDSVKIDTLPTMRDPRGALTVAEFSKFVPFPVVRLFFVCDVPPGILRGQHAHYRCSQYMICTGGRLRIMVSDGTAEKELELSVGQGVFIKPGIFATETYLDADSVMLALCDRPFEKEDYIHNLDEFRKYRAENP